MPNSLTVLNHAYRDDNERTRAVGIWAAGASFAITAGPLVGGALIAAFGWRSIFLINLPVGLAGLWLAMRHVAETPRSTRELDLPGQVTAIAGLGVLAAAMIEGGAVGWNNGWVLAGFAAFVALLVLFLFVEQRAGHPMLPLSLFKRRRFTITSVVGLLITAAILMVGWQAAREVGRRLLDSVDPALTEQAEATLLATPGVLAAGRVRLRWVGRTLRAECEIGAGAALAALSCAGLLGIERGTPYDFICVQFIALGAGLGVLVPPLTSMLLESVEKARSGIASGTLNSARQTGSVIGVSLFGSLIGGSFEFVEGTHIALTIAVVLLAGACIAMLAGGRRPMRVPS